ncbi:MAG TPA: YetF domain-containing protein, partial [Isosphaeraceae bacterium]
FLFKHRRIDQFLEGTPTVLVEQGRVLRRALARELLTEADLATVAHRQGFAGVEEIETCVLEPGGTFFIRGKRPQAREHHHGELLARLDQLSRQVEELQQQLRGR